MAMLEDIYNGGDVEGEVMEIPGFRFYPTEEELVGFYLKKRVQGSHQLNFDIVIPTLELYRYDPWELPGLAKDVAERQWFFFVPRDNKKSCPRPNRLTMSGFWKATGSDRAVRNEQLQCIGLKKTLVFYKGKSTGGQSTDWIMNEYRLPDFSSSKTMARYSTGWGSTSLLFFGTKILKESMVTCAEEAEYRVKAASWNSMEQQATPSHVEKEEPIFSAGDEYEEKLGNSFNFNGNCQLPNPMLETELSSLHYRNQKRLCSSDVCKTNDEHSLLEYPEPMMFCEETTEMKSPKTCTPPHFELATFSMDFLFSQESMASPWSDSMNPWSPDALLSTP